MAKARRRYNGLLSGHLWRMYRWRYFILLRDFYIVAGKTIGGTALYYKPRHEIIWPATGEILRLAKLVLSKCRYSAAYLWRPASSDQLLALREVKCRHAT